MSDQPWQYMFELDCVNEALALQAALDRANQENQQNFEAQTGLRFS